MQQFFLPLLDDEALCGKPWPIGRVEKVRSAQGLCFD